MALNPECLDCLYSWKFESAHAAMGSAGTDCERELVQVLARLLGDSGWFDGDLGTVVDVAVCTLIPESDGNVQQEKS